MKRFAAAVLAMTPCTKPQAVPSAAFACDCLVRAASEANAWDEGLNRHYKRAGIWFSPVVGTA